VATQSEGARRTSQWLVGSYSLDAQSFNLGKAVILGQDWDVECDGGGSDPRVVYPHP